MRIGITGTPGTGKSTSLKLVDTELDKIYLTEWCNEHYSKSGIEIEVDTDVLNTEFKKKNNFIVEGHLAHFIELDKLVILRCNPDVLRDRLAKRGYSKKKIMDNIESEALDLILIESLQMHDKSSIYEIDVTQMIIEDLAKYIESVINNNALPQFGRIDWSDVILGWY